MPGGIDSAADTEVHADAHAGVIDGAAPTRRGRWSDGPLWARPTRLHLYGPGRRSRARRATDVILAVLCLLGVAAFGEVVGPPSAIEKALIDLASALPSFLTVLWRIGTGVLALWAVVLVLGSATSRRFDVTRDHLLAVAVSLGGSWLLTEALGGAQQGLWDALRSPGPPAGPVSVRLATVAAVTVVASPHIARPYRAVSRWLLAIGSLSLVALAAASPSSAVLGLLCGTFAACTVHLAFGSAGGHPSIEEVRRGLDELGVPTTSLTEADRQGAGVFLLDATDTDGRPLVVRFYGRDAWDAQLLAKAWRAVWYRDASALTLTRLQQAEHEGFVTLLAGRNGVPVHDVVRAGRTASNDALLVLRTRGVPLDPATDAVGTETARAAWGALVGLGRAGLAHGDLAPSRLHLDGDVVVLDGLAGATATTAEDPRRVDAAQLLVTTAALVGIEDAVAVALDELGPEELGRVLPYLQPAALGPSLRSDLADRPVSLDDLRAAASEATGTEEPRLAQLRRVSVSTLVQAALLGAAGYFLISSLAGVDFAQLADALRDAAPALLVAALIFGQVPRFAQAESTRGACPRPLAYGPVAMLQFAITFVNLVVPSTAARVAVNIRFFQRQGIPPASAVSIGVIDSLGGFAAQLLILGSTLLLGWGTVDLQLDRPADADTGGLVKLVAALAVAAVVAGVVALAVPRLRHWVLAKIRPWIHEVLETVRSLRSPAKVARVLGGNLGAEILFATTLGIVCSAYGSPLPLGTLLVINVSVALFAGLMPVPGGIGVAEGALTVGLTAAGLDQATAFAVAISYRICTYYLPPLWGGVAFHRLERTGYL